MITVENLVKHFGGIHAVDNASLVIETGSITGLIGPQLRGVTGALHQSIEPSSLPIQPLPLLF